MIKHVAPPRSRLERRAEALGLRLTKKHGNTFGTTDDGITVGTWVLHHPDLAPQDGQWVKTLAEIADELDRREIMQEAAE